MPRASNQIESTRAKSTSRKDQLEKDFKKFNIDIEHEVENELRKIQEESDALKKEAGRIGEAVDSSISRTQLKPAKKKVNT